jgi:ATPase subunit of ABC transporter with duplicated ATPase domains
MPWLTGDVLGGKGRTGLVAPNGAGKSTLLRLIAGELRPRAGFVAVAGVLGYLPQSLPLTGELTVAEVLGVAAVLDALAAIESGDPSEEHFATIGDDWDVEERTRAQLDRLGLGDNLDLDARRRLHELVEGFPGCVLVVSHDRALLDRMDAIAELEPDEVRLYGGGYSRYAEAVRAEREVAERNVRNAEQELKREKREMQQARERAARRASSAARSLDDAGLAKIFAGTMKRNAQESAGRANQTHTSRVGQAQARLDEADRAVRDEQRIRLELPDTRVPAVRTVFLGERIQASRPCSVSSAGSGRRTAVRSPLRRAGSLTCPSGSTCWTSTAAWPRTSPTSRRLCRSRSG